MTLAVTEIDGGPSAVLSRKAEERDRNFRGPKPTARFDGGRQRSFADREEFRARQTPGDDLLEDPAPTSFVTEAV
jgi:small subunit ribosomal protein S6